MTNQTTICEAHVKDLAIVATDLRLTLEMLQRVDYTRQAVTETSPAFLIGWTKRELERAIEVLEAVSQ